MLYFVFYYLLFVNIIIIDSVLGLVELVNDFKYTGCPGTEGQAATGCQVIAVLAKIKKKSMPLVK